MTDGSGAAPAAGDAGAGTDGATIGADAGAVAAAGGTPAAGAGAGTAAVTAAVQAAPPPPWHGDLTEEDIGWLHNKAWFGTDLAKAETAKAFPAMVKAYRSTETMVGRDKIALPKDVNDAEGWNNVYAKLGRPSEPSGYELKAGEGGDQKIADEFAGIAHELGLSKTQAQGMAAKWDAKAQALATANAAAAEQTFLSTAQADFDALQQSWGGQADHKMAAAQRAGVTFGIDQPTMDKMERAIGTTKFLSFMADVGAAISEDSGSGQGNAAQSAMTPEAARARLSELKGDAAWVAKYQAGGADEKAEVARLNNILTAAAERAR